MSQLDYSENMPVANIGLVADLEFAYKVSYAAEGVVGYGVAVVAGTDAEKQIKVPTATGQKFRGVSISTWANEQLKATSEGEYKDKQAVNVLRKGRIWVRVNANITVDDPAYFVYTGADAGKFRNDNTDADRVPGGEFRSSANAGELAVIEINLPVAAEGQPIHQLGSQGYAGGSASFSLPITGVLATDLAMVQASAETTPATIQTVTPAAGQLDIVMSADPGASTFTYIIYR